MNKKEFDMKKELIELAHKYKMEEIEVEKKSRTGIERLKHDYDMEMQRIKSTEIKRTIQRKSDINFMRGNK